MSEASGRRAIVVAGMHRSGTSAFARCVNLLGAGIGEKLIPANWGNERGFWEDEEVIAADDALFTAVGRTWHDVRTMPELRDASAALAEPAALVARIVADETARCPLWVVKDPRLSRWVPTWCDAFAASGVEPHFLVALRHPVEVAASQARRDQFSTGKSNLLWLRHLLEVERDTRGLKRVFVLYDDLMRDWRATMARTAGVLGIDWPTPQEQAAGGIEAFLGRELRHFTIEDDRSMGADGISPAVVEAWRILHAAAGTAGDEPATGTALDRLCDGIAASEHLFAPVVDDLYRELGEARAAVDSEHAGWERDIARGKAIEEWGREVDRQLGSVRENLAEELQRRATAEGQSQLERESRLRTEAAFVEEQERRVRTAAELEDERAARQRVQSVYADECAARQSLLGAYADEQQLRVRTAAELIDERARRSHAQLGLARLSTEVESLRRRRAVRLRERWRRPGDLSDAVAPAFRQMLDDSRLFAGDLRGFGLVPSESLRGSGPRTYPLRIERPGLSRITLAVAVDAAPTAGRLEIEILSPAGATLRRAAIDAALLSESEPVGFEFEPITESPGVLRLRVGANGLDVPLRVFEWQRADLGGVARRARAFCGLGFVGRGDVVAAATNRVEDAQEGRGDDGRET